MREDVGRQEAGTRRRSGRRQQGRRAENAFVKLDGSFPGSPVPAQPVLLDQKGCFYHPRVVGARVGQVLRIKNDDNLLHNVHSSSSHRNSFNFGQPVAGISADFKLTDEEMLKVGCDVHRWMTAWIGVVDHPYFAVSGADGSFVISNVPAGKRTSACGTRRLAR